MGAIGAAVLLGIAAAAAEGQDDQLGAIGGGVLLEEVHGHSCSVTPALQPAAAVWASSIAALSRPGNVSGSARAN